MTQLVQAYDKTTGQIVPHLVPEHFLGGNLVLASQVAAGRSSAHPEGKRTPAPKKRTPARKRATKNAPGQTAGGSDATGRTGADTTKKD